jgi:hypothetical protein
MKLQKLIYLAHGYYFAVTGCPLVGEQFEAWQFGPVSPTIYHEFNRFSSSALKKGVRATRTVFCDDGSVEYVEPLFPGEAPPKVSGKKEKHVLIKMQQNMNTRCAPLSWDLLEDGFVATHLRRFLRQCFAFLEASYLPVLHWPEAWSILIKIKV